MGAVKVYPIILMFVFWKAFAQEPQCDNIPEKLRFDCFPENGATQQLCRARGCCWKVPSSKVYIEADQTELINGTSKVPLGLPYCFYPKNYGYKLTNKEETATGYLLTLVREGTPGPYGKDIENLKVDVNLKHPSKVHFKIYDPNNKRYEVPIPINTNHSEERSEKDTAVQDYDVNFSAFPFGISVIRKSTGTAIFNSAVGGMIFDDQFLQLSSLLPSATLYGLGEHVNPLLLDTNWKMSTLFSRDEGTPEGFRYNLYGAHPFYINFENDGNANGVFLLNSNAMDIVLQPTPAITYRTIGGVLDFFVFLGPTPDDVVKQYTTLVGKPFMPPYWGLGFHLCRWGYRSVSGTKKVNDRMRQYGIPQDVQWNDIDYMDRRLDFVVDPYNFSSLGEFVRDLHSKGQKYIPIVDVGISNAQPRGSYPPYDDGVKEGIFILDTHGEPIVGRVWPGTTTFPDFLNPKTQSYWQKQIQSLYSKVPIDGMWIDMNEPSNFVDGSLSGCPNNNIENPPYVPHVSGGALRIKTLCMTARHYGYLHYDVHNLYGYTEAVASMKALENIRGNRTVVISRSSFPNSGAHGGHWLGDNHATWDDIKLSIPGILNMNLFGIPLVGADICGFNGATNKELCARWTQLGAFYPFARNHNTIGDPDQDPAAFGEDFAKMARNVLSHRYRLLPYLYTLFARAHMDGSAVARPLFYEFPKDKRTYAIDQQFMWGGAILITPVLTKGATSVSGYFPEGVWYDGYEGTPIQGGQAHTLDAPWDKINIHLRGGCIVPIQQEAVTTSISRTQPFELIVGLDTSGNARGELFWDDGESLGAFKSAPYIHIRYTVSMGTLSSTIDGQFPVYPPLVYVAVCGINEKPERIIVNGVSWTSFSYNPSTKALSINKLNLSMMKEFTITWS